MAKGMIFSENLSKILLIVGLILLIVAVIIFAWNDFYFFIDGKVKSDKVGQFGDLVGGLIGSIWALAGVVLFYVALTEQRKDFATNRKVLSSQTEALKLQIKEFELQREELSATREIFKIQKFETSFFNLLKFYNEVKNSLSMTVQRTKRIGETQENATSIFVGDKFFARGNKLTENYLYVINNQEIIKGKELKDSIIFYLRQNVKLDDFNFKRIMEIYEEQEPYQNQKLAFLIFHYHYKVLLDKYMAQLLTIVKHISKSSKEIEGLSHEIYIDVLKAQISSLEFKFIWIYFYSLYKEDFELLKAYKIFPDEVYAFESKKYSK
jgi:F0F1-type ATP synthase assembly protein I